MFLFGCKESGACFLSEENFALASRLCVRNPLPLFMNLCCFLQSAVVLGSIFFFFPLHGMNIGLDRLGGGWADNQQ